MGEIACRITISPTVYTATPLSLNSTSLVEVQLVMTWFINGGTQDIAVLEWLQRELSHIATVAAEPGGRHCTWQHPNAS
jgi:hypothetical protein